MYPRERFWRCSIFFLNLCLNLQIFRDIFTCFKMNKDSIDIFTQHCVRFGLNWKRVFFSIIGMLISTWNVHFWNRKSQKQTISKKKLKFLQKQWFEYNSTFFFQSSYHSATLAFFTSDHYLSLHRILMKSLKWSTQEVLCSSNTKRIFP